MLLINVKIIIIVKTRKIKLSNKVDEVDAVIQTWVLKLIRAV